MTTYIGIVDVPGKGKSAQVQTDVGDTLAQIANAWTKNPALAVALAGFNGVNVTPNQVLDSGLTINIPFDYLNGGALLSIGATPLPSPPTSGFLDLPQWLPWAAGALAVAWMMSLSGR